MNKQASDYSVTLFHVSNEMLILSRSEDKQYRIRVKPYMAKPTKTGYVLADGSRVKATELMTFKNVNREIAAEFCGWCLPEQVEDAKLAVIWDLRKHLEKHRDLFIMMLGALESPQFEIVPNLQDDRIKSLV